MLFIFVLFLFTSCSYFVPEYYVTFLVYQTDSLTCTESNAVYYSAVAGDYCWEMDSDYVKITSISETEFTVTNCTDDECAGECTTYGPYVYEDCEEFPPCFPINVPGPISMRGYYLTKISEINTIAGSHPMEINFIDDNCMFPQTLVTFLPGNCEDKAEEEGFYFYKTCDENMDVVGYYINATEYNGCFNGTFGDPNVVMNPYYDMDTRTDYNCSDDGDRHSKEVCAAPEPILAENFIFFEGSSTDQCDDITEFGHYGVVTDTCIKNEETRSMKFFVNENNTVIGWQCNNTICDFNTCDEYYFGDVGDCISIPSSFGAPWDYTRIKQYPYSHNVLTTLSYFGVYPDWTIDVQYFDPSCLFPKTIEIKPPVECMQNEERNDTYSKTCNSIPVKTYGPYNDDQCENPNYIDYPNLECETHVDDSRVKHQRNFCGSMIPPQITMYYVVAAVYTAEGCDENNLVGIYGFLDGRCQEDGGDDNGMKFVISEDGETFVGSRCNVKYCQNCTNHDFGAWGVCSEIPAAFEPEGFTHTIGHKIPYTTNGLDVLSHFSHIIQDDWVVNVQFQDSDCEYPHSVSASAPKCDEKEENGNTYYRDTICASGNVTEQWYNTSDNGNCNSFPIWDPDTRKTGECFDEIDYETGLVKRYNEFYCGSAVHPVSTDHFVVVLVYDNDQCSGDTLGIYGTLNKECQEGGNDDGSMFFEVDGETFSGSVCTDEVCDSCTQYEFGAFDTCHEIDEAFGAQGFSHAKGYKVPYTFSVLEALSQFDDIIGDNWGIESQYQDDMCTYPKSFSSQTPDCKLSDDESERKKTHCVNGQIVREKFLLSDTQCTTVEDDDEWIMGCHGDQHRDEEGNPVGTIRYRQNFCGNQIFDVVTNFIVIQAFTDSLCSDSVGIYALVDEKCMNNGDEDSGYSSMKFVEGADETFSGSICYDTLCQNCTTYPFGDFGGCVEIDPAFHAPGFTHAIGWKVGYNSDPMEVLSGFKNLIGDDWRVEVEYSDINCDLPVSVMTGEPSCQEDESESEYRMVMCDTDEIAREYTFASDTCPAGTGTLTHVKDMTCYEDLPEEGEIKPVRYRKNFCGSMIPEIDFGFTFMVSSILLSIVCLLLI